MLEELEKLYAEVRVCPLCILSKSRTKAVPGDWARLPPTSCSSARGRATTKTSKGGPSWALRAEFLEELLAWHRDDSAKTSTSPTWSSAARPDNRDPLPDEIDACRPYLDRQIELIKPRVVITLGRFSMARSSRAGPSRDPWPGQAVGGVLLVPMFHPAAALHQPKYRRMIEEDFASARPVAELNRSAPKPAKTEEKPPSGQQLEYV